MYAVERWASARLLQSNERRGRNTKQYEVFDMATSSITHNFVIKGDAVERFANALEASFNTEVPKRSPCGRQLTDPREIREFMDRVRKRYGATDNA